MSKISLKNWRKGVVGPRFLVTASLIVVVLASGLAFLRQQRTQLQADDPSSIENTSSGLETGVQTENPTPSNTATETDPLPPPTPTDSGSTEEPSVNPSSGSTATPAGQAPTSSSSSSSSGNPVTASSRQKDPGVTTQTTKSPSGLKTSTNTTLNNNPNNPPANTASQGSTSGKKFPLGQTTSSPVINIANIEPEKLSGLSPETRTALNAALQQVETRPTLYVVVSNLSQYLFAGLLTPAAFNKFVAAAAGVPALPDLTSLSGISNFVARLGRVF